MPPGTRRSTGCPSSSTLIEYGASPRGPIGLVQAARVLALLRGRGHVSTAGRARPGRRRAAPPDSCPPTTRCRRTSPPTTWSSGCSIAVPEPAADHMSLRSGGVSHAPLDDPCRAAGPGPVPQQVVDALDLVVARRTAGVMPGDRRAAGVGTGTELAQLRPYEPGDDVRHIDPAATARTGEPHVRVHVPERTLTTWIVLDVSPSMAFGTANRLKSDVAEGVALVVARLAVRRAGTRGADDVRRRHQRSCCRARACPAGWTAVRARPEAEESPPTARTSRRRSPTRWSTFARSRVSPGSWCSSPTLRDQDGWAAAARRAARPPFGARGRAPRSARGRSSRRSATWRWSIPETGELVEVDTSSHRAARGVRAHRGRRPRRVARELRSCASSTSCSPPVRTGSGSSAGAAMSFADPILLIALLLVPLVVLAQVLARRRAERHAVRFTAIPALKLARRCCAGVAQAPAGRSGRCRARHARAGARQATAQRGRAARAGLDHARHRPLAIDARHRRGAGPPGRRKARRPAASWTRSPARAGGGRDFLGRRRTPSRPRARSTIGCAT